VESCLTFVYVSFNSVDDDDDDDTVFVLYSYILRMQRCW